MEQPGYERDGQRLFWRRTLTDLDGSRRVVTISASGIHLERGTVHARVQVMLGAVVLAWDTINVERNSDRNGLSNEVYPHLNGLSEVLPKNYLKHELDLFCAGLWDAHIDALMPVLMEGSLNSEPPAMLLAPYILEGGGTIIFAPPGKGKSYVMLLMAVAIDAGLVDLWPVQQRRVLFINLERGAKSVGDRLGNVNRALGKTPSRPLLTLNARGRSLVDVWDGARRAVVEQNVGCVMLDSISRTGAGDLNENLSGNSTIDLMNGLCDTWCALGHSPRANSTHLYGSQMFDAGADVMVRLVSQQEKTGPLGIGLQIVKSNDVGKHGMQIIALEFNSAGLAGVRRARAHEFPEVEAEEELSMRSRVLDYLTEHGADTATKVADSLSLNRSNVSALLARDDVFVVVRKEGNSVFYGVREKVDDIRF